MSTRAYIVRETRPGYFQTIYNYSNGDPDSLGRILKRNFRNKAAVDKLMSCGDIEYIDPQTGQIVRDNEYGESSVLTARVIYERRHAYLIDYLYEYKRGAWKAIDLRDREVAIP